MPLAEVTGLVTGVVGLRLAADAVLDLWQRDEAPTGGPCRGAARTAGSTHLMVDWYDRFAASLTGRERRTGTAAARPARRRPADRGGQP